MRCFIVFAAFLFIISALAISKKSKTRYTRHGYKQVENLNMIRRGPVERGIQSNNTSDNVLILGQDGVMRYGSLQNELINKCRANFQKEYKLCAGLSNDCDLCSASSYCGWCESAPKGKQCVPGFTNGTNCAGDCLSHWRFNKDSCTGSVKSGSLDNIAPEATKLVNAVFANPKVQIDTKEVNLDDQKEEILVGHKTFSKKISYLDNQGQLHVKENHHEKPIYGEIHRNVPTGVTFHKKVIDLATGNRLDLQELEKKNHGTDGGSPAGFAEVKADPEIKK